jgi:hypothetical protein
MAYRLHVVVTVDEVTLGTTATFAVDNGITSANAKRARADSHALHHLFYSFCHGAHAGAPRGYGRHATERLQALGEGARMPVNISIKASESHNLSLCGQVPQSKVSLERSCLPDSFDNQTAEHFPQIAQISQIANSTWKCNRSRIQLLIHRWLPT